MKLLRDTPRELVLIHRPVLLCAGLWTGAALLVCVALWTLVLGDVLRVAVALLLAAGFAGPAAFLSAERTEITFDAARQTVRIESRKLSGPVEEEYPLARVLRTTVESHKSPYHPAGVHRLALVLDTRGTPETRPMTSAYAPGHAPKEMADRINHWLDAARGDPAEG